MYADDRNQVLVHLVNYPIISFDQFSRSFNIEFRNNSPGVRIVFQLLDPEISLSICLSAYRFESLEMYSCIDLKSSMASSVQTIFTIS